MLDKSKPYRTFVGCNSMGARYQQGNSIYNASGEEVDWEGNLVKPKTTRKSPARKKKSEAPKPESPTIPRQEASTTPPRKPLEPLKPKAEMDSFDSLDDIE